MLAAQAITFMKSLGATYATPAARNVMGFIPTVHCVTVRQ